MSLVVDLPPENKAGYKHFYSKNVPLSFLSLAEFIVNLLRNETLM